MNGVSLINSPVLVLNQNYQPLNICNARRAFILMGHGKAELLENGGGYVRSITQAFPVPSVIRLVYMVKRPLMRRLAVAQGSLLQGRPRLPVLRQTHQGADPGPHRAPLPRRCPRVGERGQRVHPLQPPQSGADPRRGQDAAPQAALRLPSPTPTTSSTTTPSSKSGAPFIPWVQ